MILFGLASGRSQVFDFSFVLSTFKKYDIYFEYNVSALKAAKSGIGTKSFEIKKAGSNGLQTNYNVASSAPFKIGFKKSNFHVDSSYFDQKNSIFGAELPDEKPGFAKIGTSPFPSPLSGLMTSFAAVDQSFSGLSGFGFTSTGYQRPPTPGFT
jgi:hypothetical protein